jgi:F-type H+-transporting ATPase subunit epsilon
MFKFTVLQVDKVVYEGEITQVTCPSFGGEITILSHHTPLVTPLKEGGLRVVNKEGEIINIPVFGGILEVGSNEAVVLL